MDLNKKRYILVRKIIKGVIVLFWSLTFIVPFLIHTSTSEYDVADSYTYICWGRGFIGGISPYHSLHLLLFVLFLIGFFLSFGNIKTNYKRRIINRNIGNIGGIIVLISGIGMSISIQFIFVGIGVLDGYETKDGVGMYFPIIIAILIFGETYFLNRVKIMEAEIVKEEPIEVQEREVKEISGKLYCSSCGEEILDKTGDFCSKCGAPLK
ncbi:unnamed protein product [marine sediment metagenome]|uniref:Zinc-ribbon domain-containing protein n=1 Tax=marine sediment metagenome TaxID=412755 RepID=X1DDG3_9ZZZZ